MSNTSGSGSGEVEQVDRDSSLLVINVRVPDTTFFPGSFVFDSSNGLVPTVAVGELFLRARQTIYSDATILRDADKGTIKTTNLVLGDGGTLSQNDTVGAIRVAGSLTAEFGDETVSGSFDAPFCTNECNVN